MIRRAVLLLSVAGSIGGLAACGSSSTSSTPSTPAGSTSSSTTSTASGGSSSVSNNPAVTQAVAACKSSINAATTLSSSVKEKLVKLCDQAASGDVAGAKKVAKEVCKEIVNSSVPSSAPSSLKDQALAACEKA